MSVRSVALCERVCAAVERWNGRVGGVVLEDVELGNEVRSHIQHIGNVVDGAQQLDALPRHAQMKRYARTHSAQEESPLVRATASNVNTLGALKVEPQLGGGEERRCM